MADRWVKSIVGLVLLAAALHTTGCQPAGGLSAAAGVALKVRDVGCTGGRVVCRIMDRTCRGSGGPWVVPRSDEEVVQDQRAGAFGEVTGSGEEGDEEGSPE